MLMSSCFTAFCACIFSVSSLQNTLLFGEDFYARKSVRLQQTEAQMHREMLDSRIGIPSKSKAYSTELIDGYDLSDQFHYLPDDSVDTTTQQVNIWIQKSNRARQDVIMLEGKNCKF